MTQLKVLLLLLQFLIIQKGNAESHLCGNERKSCCLGWSGVNCDQPVCDNNCGPGKCVQPNVCDCRETNRFGTNCQHFASEVAAVSQNYDMANQAQCLYLNGRTYKTFDREKAIKTNFEGSFVLLQDCLNRPPFYQIIVIPQGNCSIKSSDNCEIVIKFLFKEYSEAVYVSSTGVNEDVYNFSFPYSKGDLQISDRGQYLYIKGIKDLTIFYNKKGSIFVFAPVTMKNQVCGLCGLYDANGENSKEIVDASMKPLQSELEFVKSWISVTINNRVRTDPTIEDINCDLNEKAVCDKLINVFGSKFQSICETEFCQMKNPIKSCDFFTDLAFLSSPEKAIDNSWRQKFDCDEPNCQNRMIWSDCGNNCNNRCGFNNDGGDCSKVCTPGCYCRKDFFWYNNQCKRADECPCEYRSSEKQYVFYKFGDRMKKGCQNCLCESQGLWKCDTHDQCTSRCIITGDPHFITFDNQHIFVEGQCQYIAVMPKDNDIDMPVISIIVENKFCFNSEDVTCAKGIKILLGEGANQTEIEIKSKTDILINNKPVLIPSKINKGVDISIFRVTNDGLKIEAGDLFSVFRKDDSRIELVLSAKYGKKVTGLCGNYNGDPEDDNIMPDGAPAKDDTELAARYRLSQTCHGDVLRQSYLGLCETSIEWGRIADKICSKFGQGKFKACETLVPSDKFITQCRHDVCNCGLLKNATTLNCECAAYSAYARLCSIKGIQFDWRTEDFCPVICPKNMIYKECGSSCSATCRLRQRPNCDNDCIDGCQCPDNMVIEEKTGLCVKIADCKCDYLGRDYNANEKRQDRCNVCTCIGGLWNCTNNNCSIQNYCSNGKVWKDCGGCERTCRDMNLICDPKSCEPGCYCENGEVFNNGKCMPKGDCPCFWQNQSYNESAVITRGPFECQLKCTCNGGKWDCPKRDCAGMCKAWGEPHYMTFDGKFFDFHGDCTYVLMEDYCNKKSGTFKILIENVECGSKGTSCTKSIKFYYKDQIIHLIRGTMPIISKNPTWPPYLGSGIFSKHDYISSLLIITKEITIQWDRQLSVDIILSPDYKNKVCGLCGNFDDVVDNDFRNRAGIIDSDVNAFSDSWKMKTSCPYPVAPQSPCDINKFRESWAIKRCSILKSETFEPCHNVVRYQLYYDKCVMDSCACDRGDDCLCVCTAISQYVHECNRHNIKIQWRNYENCPVMCPPDREYKSCEKVCPETCFGPASCVSNCMEGCFCKNNTYLKDDQCVSEKPQCTCKDENGKEYPVGTTLLINCHKCTCITNEFECDSEVIAACSTTLSSSTTISTTMSTTLNKTSTLSTTRSTTVKTCEEPVNITRLEYVKSVSASSIKGNNGGAEEVMTNVGWQPQITDLSPEISIEFQRIMFVKTITFSYTNVRNYTIFMKNVNNQWQEFANNSTVTTYFVKIPNVNREIIEIKFNFQKLSPNLEIKIQISIEGCGEKQPTTVTVTPTTTTTETTTTTISTTITPTTSKTPPISTQSESTKVVTTPSVCKDNVIVVSSKEYIKNLVVSSNQNDKEKVLTENWKPEKYDSMPRISIAFLKPTLITNIIIENHSNIGRYSIMVTKPNSYSSEILMANIENTVENQAIEINNLNIEITEITLTFIKKVTTKDMYIKLVIKGCEEKISTPSSSSTTTPISTVTTTPESTTTTTTTTISTTTPFTTKSIGCKETPYIISTKEFIKEILVSSNEKQKESVITDKWTSTVVDSIPTVELKFFKPATITKVLVGNPANVQSYTVSIIKEHTTNYVKIVENQKYTMEHEYIEIPNVNEKVIAIKISVSKNSPKENSEFKVVIEGCGDKETTTTSTTTSSSTTTTPLISSTTTPISTVTTTIPESTTTTTTTTISTTTPSKTASESTTTSSSTITTTPSTTTTTKTVCLQIEKLSTYDYVERILSSSNSNFEIPIYGQWESEKEDEKPWIDTVFKGEYVLTEINLEKAVNIKSFSLFFQLTNKNIWHAINENIFYNETINQTGAININLKVKAVRVIFHKEYMDKTVKAFLSIFGCEKQYTTIIIPTISEHTETTPLNKTTQHTETTTPIVVTTTNVKIGNCSFFVESKSKIKQGNCVSEQEIETGYCSGACPSRSSIDPFTGDMNSKCLCCQPIKIKRSFQFSCVNNSKSVDIYVVSGCSCNSCETKIINQCPK